MVRAPIFRAKSCLSTSTSFLWLRLTVTINWVALNNRNVLSGYLMARNLKSMCQQAALLLGDSIPCLP